MFKELIGICYGCRNNLDGKLYVGSSIRFRSRQQKHLKSLLEGVHHSIKFQRAWDKHGADNFEWVILDTITNENNLEPERFDDILRFRETYFIELYDAVEKGYNICPVAGSSLGVKRTQETIDRLRVSQQHRWADQEKRSEMSDIKKAYNRENPEAAAQHSEDLTEYWSVIANRVAQSERRIAYIESHPEYGDEHRGRMQVHYEQHPEKRDEMSDLKHLLHKANPQAAVDARVRATKHFSDPAKRQVASDNQIAFLNSPAEVLKREQRDSEIRSRLQNGMTVREIVAETGTSSSIITVVRKTLVADGLLPEGNKRSEKTRARMRKPKSDKAKANMSSAQLGREVTEETRETLRQITNRQFEDPAARQIQTDKANAFYNSPEQVLKREQRDAPIREMILKGVAHQEIIKTLHVGSATVSRVRNSLKEAA